MRRTSLLILTAAAVVGVLVFALQALGDALADRSNEPSETITGNGLIAYVVALTDWNTPGGPDYESPMGPTRIGIVHPDDPSPRYVGASRPQAGEPPDDWLSVRQQCPTFSPDGTRLAFVERVANRGFNPSGVVSGRLVIVRLDDQGRSTGEELRVQGACPTWSPDGQGVAFVDVAAGSAITILDLDGSQQSIRLPERSGDLVSLAWSPDGRAIAAIDRSVATGFGFEGALWLIPMTGEPPFLVYDGDTPMQGKPAWSPDSTEIAIALASAPEPTPDPNGAIPSAPEEWMVMVVPAREGGRALEVGRGIAPVWSPTGDRLAYLANPSGGPGASSVGDIVVVEPGGEERDVIPPALIAPGTALSDYNSERGAAGVAWRAHPPIWSPDGSKLLFIGSDGTWGTSVLFSVSPTGDEEPTPVSETWVAEWYGEAALSWQSVMAPD